ncbi:DHA2 family efflux MFS transporter permease subunit [Mycobacterium angelicum]|uniref:MFS transporter n=1 Tax=Mycobacterium angelicum TaxID=470074 RepID=A0A1W9Z8V1_MYCAN|nr:DHA2 family efflux MFS transporter permease subunit [Mycobacterium angelicum]MCV7200343.1 DHA2 family efflux MFS transporter permease subunit [Mycobacterium angelicum]ORA09239.1 MFS transporter [Mycobacterium angelicum]
MRQADRPPREPKIASTHATGGSRLDGDASPVDDPTTPTTLDSRLVMTTVTCLMLAVMVSLDTTVVNVAQRTFVDEFSSTQAIVAWTSSGYTLSLAAVIPITGWAANRLGAKRLAMASVLLFTFGSLLCALASNITQLVAFRAVQGLGGGIVIPLQLIILARAAGPARLARVMTISNITVLMPPIFGPILGGWLISSFGWQWIFLINIPVGALVLALAVSVLPSDDSSSAESLDVLGIIVLSPGLVLLLYGLSLLPERGTVRDPHIWVPMTIGVMLIAAFVLHVLRRADHALIDLRLLKNRPVAAANGTRFVFAVAFFGSSLLFPAYFQQVLGKTPFQSGLLLIPQSLAAAVAIPIVGRLTETRGPRGVVLAGTAATVVGMGIFVYGMSREHVHLTMLLAGLATFGAGSACMMVPVSWSAVYTLNSSEVAHGSTLFNVTHTVAASVGAALMSVMLTSRFNESATIAAARQADSIRAEAARRLVPLDPAELPSQVRLPDFTEHLSQDLSLAYAGVFLIGMIVAAATAVPASFLPKRPATRVELVQVEP